MRASVGFLSKMTTTLPILPRRWGVHDTLKEPLALICPRHTPARVSVHSSKTVNSLKPVAAPSCRTGAGYTCPRGCFRVGGERPWGPAKLGVQVHGRPVEQGEAEGAKWSAPSELCTLPAPCGLWAFHPVGEPYCVEVIK